MSTPNRYSAISRIGWILYLAGKDDDLLDDTGNLVLQQLLNDVNTESTGPNDGKVCVSRHESTLFAVCGIWGAISPYCIALPFSILSGRLAWRQPHRYAYEAADLPRATLEPPSCNESASDHGSLKSFNQMA